MERSDEMKDIYTERLQYYNSMSPDKTKVVKETKNNRGQITYRKYANGRCEKSIYDENGHLTSHRVTSPTQRNSKTLMYWYRAEYDKNGNCTYDEDSYGNWWQYEYDENGNCVLQENNDGYWGISKYNSRNNKTYYEDSTGFWAKLEYNSHNDCTHYESSTGIVQDTEFYENGHTVYIKRPDGTKERQVYNRYDELLLCEPITDERTDENAKS